MKEFDYHPERTVPGRRGPSLPARYIVENGFAEHFGIKRILDFGCGKGLDISYYRKFGYHAEGYDPHEPFGYSRIPEGKFDLVLMSYVLNVIPGMQQRIEAVKIATQSLADHGIFLIIARSDVSVNRKVKLKNWEKHKDGYWANKKRGMFQKGLSKAELIQIAKKAGLQVHPFDEQIKFDSFSRSLMLTYPGYL